MCGLLYHSGYYGNATKKQPNYVTYIKRELVLLKSKYLGLIIEFELASL